MYYDVLWGISFQSVPLKLRTKYLFRCDILRPLRFKRLVFNIVTRHALRILMEIRLQMTRYEAAGRTAKNRCQHWNKDHMTLLARATCWQGLKWDYREFLFRDNAINLITTILWSYDISTVGEVSEKFAVMTSVESSIKMIFVKSAPMI